MLSFTSILHPSSKSVFMCGTDHDVSTVVVHNMHKIELKNISCIRNGKVKRDAQMIFNAQNQHIFSYILCIIGFYDSLVDIKYTYEKNKYRK